MAFLNCRAQSVRMINEIDAIIGILEAQLPANPNSPQNEKLERRLQRDLARYFKALLNAFPYDNLNELYYHYVKESLGSEARDILDPLLRTFQNDLVYRLNGHLATVYIRGSVEMVTWGRTKGGLPIAYEGPPIDEAITWAERHCAQLVTRMADETKEQLAKVVSDAIQNKRGVPCLARDILKAFDGMTKYRSQLIARTETANALGEAFLVRGKEMGIEGKEWIKGSAYECDICDPNADAGVIPFNQPFPSGHMTVPGHPQCTCACAPARLTS